MQHIHLTFMGLLDPGGVVHLSCVRMIIVSTVSDCFHAGKLLAELHPRAKRARGQSPIAKEMW